METTAPVSGIKTGYKTEESEMSTNSPLGMGLLLGQNLDSYSSRKVNDGGKPGKFATDDEMLKEAFLVFFLKSFSILSI